MLSTIFEIFFMKNGVTSMSTLLIFPVFISNFSASSTGSQAI